MSLPKKLKSNSIEHVDIMEVQKGQVRFCVLGSTPLIYEAMSFKGKCQLLAPGKTKTQAERQQTMKHHPLDEFRESVYRLDDHAAPTALAAPSAWFKKAMIGSAIDVPGATKSAMGRLCWVLGESSPLYGVPMLKMDMVRSSDMNRTPDIRTRAIVREWATMITIEFARPQVTEKTVTNLLAWGGMIRGVGGWRPEKGSGQYGQFRLTGPTDPAFVRVLKTGGRVAQLAALDAGTCYDHETRRLFDYFQEAMRTRELTKASPAELGNGKKRKGAVGSIDMTATA
jgi:hypothetical protein